MSVTESRSRAKHHAGAARPGKPRGEAPVPVDTTIDTPIDAPVDTTTDVEQGEGWRPIVDQDDAARFPHACQPDTIDASADTVGRRSRLLGLDVARGIALIGMIAIHTIESDDGNGVMSLPWVLSLGKASALFAVLGGVGIAFITGRRAAPRGRLAARMSLVSMVRGLVVVLIGLLLGSLVPSAQAMVVLPYLGAMFIVAALLVPLRTRTLLVLGFAWAFIAPVLSHVVRAQLPAQAAGGNLTLGSLADPLHVLTVVFFTGAFPVVTWMAYVCIGLALGRSNLRARATVATMFVGGVLLTLVTAVASRLLLDQFGVRERLADDVAGRMSLETFTDVLVFGGSGTVPTDSAWWLAVNAPHTGTTLDLLYTIGISLTVIGACLALTSVFGTRFALLAVPGSMTLTIYSLHVIALAPIAALTEDVSFSSVEFWLHMVPLVLFALIWAHFFARGPLEEVVARITNAFRPRRPEAYTELYTKGGTYKRDGKVVARS